MVYAVAWKRHPGPSVVWRSVLDGPCRLTYELADDRATAETVAECGRLADLLAGRGRRPGRRPLAEDSAWRLIAEEAEARYRARPSLGWATIARIMSVNDSTLRKYRALLRRERSASDATTGPTLLQGGDAAHAGPTAP